MARRASIATGNFLTAGTWGTIDATLYANSETSTLVVPTAYSNVARSAQATPGAITVTHIGIKLAVRTGTTGTMTVHIASSTHVEIAGTAVTINTADLPVAATADLNGGWHFFKLGVPVTLTAATLYEVEAKTSNATQISVFGSAATNGMSCALITNATGAPAAGDDLVVAGEYTGAGTSNSFTVTMDALASSITDYGAASTSLVLPSLAICNKGTLAYGTTAATNYYLRQSGNVIVYSGGTLNIGTTGTPIPRDSSAILNFDCVANIDFGLTVRNLGTFVTQGLSRTSGKNIVSCKLNTDEAANSTSLGVDTDTGWLDNDEIAVASTTRTSTDCENGTLNGNAGASTLTVDGFGGAGGGLLVAHSGTSPTQAEVILLTRNVRIFGVSTTVQAYIDIRATATVDCDWTEFKWLGGNATNRFGIDIATTTGSFAMSYCSLRNFEVSGNVGLNFTGASGNGYLAEYNVFYRVHSANIANVATTNTTWIIDNNIMMRSIANTILNIADIGGTFTNNTIAGQTGSTTGALISENNARINNFSNITFHSSAGSFLLGNSLEGTITTFNIWRNNSNGLIPRCAELKIVNLTAFGNNGSHISLSSADAGKLTFDNAILNGDTTFATTSGIVCAQGSFPGKVTFISSDFSTVSGIKTAHTNDINIGSVLCPTDFVLINTKLGAATEVATQSFLTESAIISSQKHDQTAGLHKTWKKYGIITIETTTTQSGGHSVKLTPNNASGKLESSGLFGGFKVAVANGATVTPTVYVYEDASYNGARARLIVKRNDALGITADTVLDTATASSDAAWEALTGTTAAVTDDGTLEFVVDCDGTAGNLFVDSFSVA